MPRQNFATDKFIESKYALEIFGEINPRKMCDTVFSFGERGGYYFESPSQWQYGLLPDKFKSLFNEDKIAKTYCVVLGAEDSFLVSYLGKDGNQYVRAYGIPPSLHSWVFEKDSSGSSIRDFDKLRISLGPKNDSYFATDGTSYKWCNLPKEFDAALEQRRKPGGGFTVAPRLVALGVGGNYIMITEGHGGSWNVSNYKELDATIDFLREKEEGLALIHNLALDPHRLQNYILQAPNGAVLSTGAPPHATDGIEAITTAIKSDTERQAQREQAELRELQQLVATQRAMQQRQQAENMLLAQQMAQLNRMQRRMNRFALFSGLVGGMAGLSMAGGGMNPYGGLAFDPSAFWQPIYDAASMPIQ